MELLRKTLDELIATLPDANAFRSSLETLISVYPFNEYEYIIATLLAAGKLSREEYIDLRDTYIARNLFLYIFEISAPRRFGEASAQGHLKELVPELQKPSKKLDKTYSGEYDFVLDSMIKIEVKASRAVDSDSDEPLYVKALDSKSTKRLRHELSASEAGLLSRFRMDWCLARRNCSLGVKLERGCVESLLFYRAAPRKCR